MSHHKPCVTGGLGPSGSIQGARPLQEQGILTARTAVGKLHSPMRAMCWRRVCRSRLYAAAIGDAIGCKEDNCLRFGGVDPHGWQLNIAIRLVPRVSCASSYAYWHSSGVGKGMKLFLFRARRLPRTGERSNRDLRVSPKTLLSRDGRRSPPRLHVSFVIDDNFPIRQEQAWRARR